MKPRLSPDSPTLRVKSVRPTAASPVVFAGPEVLEYREWVEHGIARPLKRPMVFWKMDGDFFTQGANRIKKAGLVVVWNGAQAHGRNITALCAAMKIPMLYIEWGVMPQAGSYLVDPRGLVGDSVLMSHLGWVTPEDIQRFETDITPIRARYPLEPTPGRILLPLQIENDTQVLYSGGWRNGVELIDEALARYPGRQIVVRPHPKSGNQYASGHSSPLVTIESKEEVPDFLDAARRSEMVVGINSTGLTEAAMLGVEVVALGECPLRAQPRRFRRRLLAGYWALRVPRDTTPLGVMRRFGCLPVDPDNGGCDA